MESVVGSLATLAAAAMGLAAGVEASAAERSVGRGRGAGEEAGRAEEATPVVAALGAATVEGSAGSVGLAAQAVETVVQTVAATATFESDSLCRG